MAENDYTQILSVTDANGGFSWRRSGGRTSGGQDWVCLLNRDTDQVEFWYSNDDGDTWTSDSGADLTAYTSAVDDGIAMYIDGNDNVWVTYASSSTNQRTYRGTISGNAITWDTTNGPYDRNIGTNLRYTDIVAFEYNTGTLYDYCVVATYGSAGTVGYEIIEWDRVSSYTSRKYTNTLDTASNTFVDFNHAAGSKAVQGSAPDIWLGFRDSGNVLVYKLTWSTGTTWTNGILRTLVSTADTAYPTTFHYDGDRIVAVYQANSGAEGVPQICERNAADTTTTTSLADGVPYTGNSQFLHAKYDSSQDIYLYGLSFNDKTKWCKYDRSADKWSAWHVVDGLTSLTGNVWPASDTYLASGQPWHIGGTVTSTSYNVATVPATTWETGIYSEAIWESTHASEPSTVWSQNGKAMAEFSDGRVLMMRTPYYSDSSTISFYVRSAAGGIDSWTLCTGTIASAYANGNQCASIFIDASDVIWVVYSNSVSASGAYVKRGTISGTTITWGTSYLFESGATFIPQGGIDCVAWTDGTDDYIGIVGKQYQISTMYIYLWVVKRTSGGTYSMAKTRTTLQSYSSTTTYTPQIDFNHTGDGKTLLSSTPHLYVTWRVDSISDVLFNKVAYSAGPTWTPGTNRTIDATTTTGKYGFAWDGTRVVFLLVDGATPYRNLTERDAGDTTTTARTPTDVYRNQAGSTAFGWINQANDDVYLGGAESASADPMAYALYDRGGNSWDATMTILGGELDVLSARSLPLSAEPTYWCWSDGAGIDKWLTFNTAPFTYNEPPTAPTWVSPTDGSAHDVASTLLLDWSFNDPDPGDTQSAFTVRRKIGTGSYNYWNGTTWVSTETATKIVTATTSHLMASSWGTGSDADHYYSVKTWDAADAGPSPWSTEQRVIPSAIVNPVITSPVDAGTPTVGATHDVTWTCTDQSKYRVVVSDTTGGTMDTGTLDYDSGIIIDGVGRTQQASFPTNSVTRYVKVQTWNGDGLASALDEVDVSVSYTPPSTPTTVNSSNTPAGAITVNLDNPAGGSTVDYNDIYRRVGDDASTEIRIATGVAVDGSFIDYTPRSGVVYKYKIRAIGTNGSTADSTWTS